MISLIAVVTTVVWAVTYMATLFIEGYSPPAGVHAAFLGLLGAVFGFEFVRRNGSG